MSWCLTRGEQIGKLHFEWQPFGLHFEWQPFGLPFQITAHLLRNCHLYSRRNASSRFKHFQYMYKHAQDLIHFTFTGTLKGPTLIYLSLGFAAHLWSVGNLCFRQNCWRQDLHWMGTSSDVLHPLAQHRFFCCHSPAKDARKSFVWTIGRSSHTIVPMQMTPTSWFLSARCANNPLELERAKM